MNSFKVYWDDGSGETEEDLVMAPERLKGFVQIVQREGVFIETENTLKWIAPWAIRSISTEVKK